MACVYGISIHINTYRHTFRFYALSRNGFVGSFFAADRFSSDYKPENVFILSNFVANTAHTHTTHTDDLPATIIPTCRSLHKIFRVLLCLIVRVTARKKPEIYASSFRQTLWNMEICIIFGCSGIKAYEICALNRVGKWRKRVKTKHVCK